MTPSFPHDNGRREPHAVAPVLSVRFTDAGPVASSLTVRPGHTSGAVPVGDGVFLGADPSWPADQLWVPLDRLRLELLHRLAERSPCVVESVVEEVAAGLVDEPAARKDLTRAVDQLRSAGLIAPEGAHEWSGEDGAHRCERIRWEQERPGEPAPVDLADGRPLWRPDRGGLLVTPQGFERLHADGSTRDVLTAIDVAVLGVVSPGRDAARAYEALSADPTIALSREEFDERLRWLAGRGFVKNLDAKLNEAVTIALQAKARAYADAESTVRQILDEERVRTASTGVKRPIVLAVDADTNPLLALGTIVAYAQAYDGGCLTEDYRFAPLLYTAPHRLPDLLPDLVGWPTVFLFSDYTWTREANLVMGAAVKAQLPAALTVHGGPELPRNEADAERFFRDHPHVDCGVRVEGEVTLAELLAALVPSIPEWGERARLPDLAPLATVDGLTYRTDTGLVRTGERERITDLETIPSPYLTGLFDGLGRREIDSVIFEGSRGCPYGCTFCDWGSATLSRIRKFSLERIKAEMEWAARRGISNFGMTDANFGILEQDVDIADWAVELKSRYGVPTSFQVTYSKNRVQNLTRIVRTLAEADIVTQAAVSVQTFDKDVLRIVRRKNLDLSLHVPLVNEFEDLGLPLFSDVMVGLPGSTVDTVRTDLQFCVDREIHYRPNPTQLLVNSPMNDESYRLEHGIVATPGDYLLETRTYTKDDMRTMMDLAEYLLMADRRGTLRELATYVRRELRVPEVVFYEQLIDAGRDGRRWPHLGYLNSVVTREFVPPGSWTGIIEEIGDFMVELGVADDDALATVLAVQRALIPMSGRRFPETLHLPHDYLAWHASVRAARQVVPEGEWIDEVPPLRALGPGELVIRDDTDSCSRVIGMKPRGSWEEIVWELDTPIARSAQRVAQPA
jgi:radical SAM superfamily enzyme YgiQ (UPF0313 family)